MRVSLRKSAKTPLYVLRMNLNPSIRMILDSYALNKTYLNADEQAVLKTLLLFQAIDLESSGKVDIFRPSEKNLDLAFAGSDRLGDGRAVKIAADLVQKEILFKKPGRPGEPETFAAMALSGDFAEIERQKKHLREITRTASLVDDGNLIGTIPLTASQKMRYDLTAVTADNFTMTLNRMVDAEDDYRIKAAVCFARNDDERNKIYKIIIGAVGDGRYNKLVIIDASANLLERETFELWIKNSATETYWRGKNTPLANQMKSNAADCLKEWRNSFDAGSFVYYPSTTNKNERREGISCQGVYRLIDALKENVRRIYPYSFDDANITGTLFLSSQPNKMAELGIRQEAGSMLNKESIKTVFGDAWQAEGKYWQAHPDLIISRLKVELDALIKKELDKNVRIAFDDIFKHLLELGFMPLNIYAALTGFLLKEYAAEPYRYSAGFDGDAGGAMSIKKLAECIGESIKQASPAPVRGYRPKYLEIMSQNQRQFMLFASEIFGVSEDISVEQCAQKLRLKLKNLGYPLWCYVEAAADRYKEFLQRVAEIANSKGAVSVSAVAEKAGQFLLGNPIAFNDMKRFLTLENGRGFFTDFVRNFEGGRIFELAQEIGIADPVEECRQRVISGDGIWLRDKETAEEDFRKLIDDYRIIAASRNFGIDGRSLKECVKNWADHCRFNLKIPADVLGDQYPSRFEADV